MSNYLQYQLIISCLILCTALQSTQVLAADPAYDSSRARVDNKEPQAALLEHYALAAQNQIEKLSKNILGDKSDESKEKGMQLGGDPISMGLKNKVIAPLRNLIYNPEHPAELFNKLVAGYSFYLCIEKNSIPWGEKLLGKDNQIIISAKQNYKTDTLYLEALQQQKLMLEKSGKNKQNIGRHL